MVEDGHSVPVVLGIKDLTPQIVGNQREELKDKQLITSYLITPNLLEKHDVKVDGDMFSKLSLKEQKKFLDKRFNYSN